MKYRIFQSALNEVKYVFGRPLSVREYLRLPEKDRLQGEAFRDHQNRKNP